MHCGTSHGGYGTCRCFSGVKKVRTTISRKAVAAGDRVNRQFVAERPDQLWVADFTYVSTWQGFVYVAFHH
ncbi:transposase encoded within prophage CP-933U [Escherichia coli]|uniref:Transposase encoded within prophage CP-933U n=1 Tax=Escherichia coli TaxID=562 RepID=A0A377HHE2_ECOLX|nr:transposase encoded within prophage CP-933U [Escherichia coli]